MHLDLKIYRLAKRKKSPSLSSTHTYTIEELTFSASCTLLQLLPNLRFLDANIDHLPPIPPTLTHLTVYANEHIDFLPPPLTHITFSPEFNLPVDHLPASLLRLSFDYSFNQPVDYLPPCLAYLSFGMCFSCPVDYLPFSLIIIVIFLF